MYIETGERNCCPYCFQEILKLYEYIKNFIYEFGIESINI